MGAQGPFKPGDTFGRFRIEKILGRGGMGAVYEALDTGLGRSVALKVLFRELADEPAFIERFGREQATASISHPNVVRIHEGGVEEGLPFIVMELLPGGTLADRLKREGRLGWKEVARLGAQIASALDAVHAAKLVHRDLKPANVLVDQDGNAKLADFGVVRTENATLTKTGELLGTPQYMAPEQVDQGKRVDFRADLYSLGATLYALLVGHAPFDGPGYVVISRKLSEQPSSTSSEVDGIPPALDQLLLELLAREPAKRPASAALVARKLDAIARGKLHRKEESAGWRAVAAGAILALAVVAVAIGFAVSGRGGPSPPPPPPGEVIELAITAPRDGAAVASDSVVVSGHARGAASLEVEGEKLAIGADGSFAATVKLESSERTIKVAALGARRKEERSVTVFRVPPWFLGLDASERPRPPLPRGLRFGDAGSEYVNEKDGSVLVFVPAGTFVMGGKDAEIALSLAPTHRSPPPRQPAHDVSLSAYFIGKYEVSVAQFERFVKEKRFRTTAEAAGQGNNLWAEGGVLRYGLSNGVVSWLRPQQPDGPEEDRARAVTMVSPADADAYCAWAGLDLPTEAQWERAASWDERSQEAKKRRYPWGDTLPSGANVVHAADVTFLEHCGVTDFKGAFPAGTRFDAPHAAPIDANPDGKSPVGAFNMAGNVAEWCRDALDPDFYERCRREGPSKDPYRAPRPGEHRVHRGGHWGSLADETLCARRFYERESYAPCDTIGFRVARDTR